MGVLQQVDKVDNKGVQLGFAALQVKERQVSRRMEREEEEEEEAFLMRVQELQLSFLSRHSQIAPTNHCSPKRPSILRKPMIDVSLLQNPNRWQTSSKFNPSLL